MRAGLTGDVDVIGGPAGACACATPAAGRRWSSLAAGVAALLEIAAAAIRSQRARRERRAKAGALRDALHALDDRTLRDLGFHRDEIASVAAEATGEAAPSRIRTMRDLHGTTM